MRAPQLIFVKVNGTYECKNCRCALGGWHDYDCDFAELQAFEAKGDVLVGRYEAALDR